ncbi:GWT1-domain-containing protein [Cantharellus anzutake]|uniref:GWT1-domain-containing protein n=1 Tax=Cantharellus anzutake TaxID=1750568 RepID=UPI0019053DBD|nr:GWT1-domain-containing protein [Cantharellus anzutake]KAF8336428.1 GWT1-domain-containing protein [Cantharellus anzutake]
MKSSYKLEKERFVSFTSGSSVWHVNSISAVALASIVLHSTLKSRFSWSGPGGASFPSFTIDFIILVIPLLLSMTAFAEAPWQLVSMLLIPAGLILLFRPPTLSAFSLLPPLSPPSRSTSPIPPRANTRSPSNRGVHLPDRLSQSFMDESKSTTSLLTGPVPYLTTYRAHMMLMTILAILAVDFNVFPRELAKCETFGVSLMDLGVGSFVFSQGLVSATPILRDVSILKERSVPKMFYALRKVLPLLALGMIRVILVKGTDYPEHVSEYGVHWNFFLTMVFLPPLSVLLHPIILQTPIALVGISISIVHEMMLRKTSLEAWILSPHRHSLLSQNKEGITSLIGYLALHVLGLSMGTLLLPASPSLFKRQLKLLTGNSDASSMAHQMPSKRQPGKAAIELCSYAFTWWILFGLSTSARRHHKSAVSRRLANLPYVLWVAAFNTTVLLGYLLIDTHFFHVKPPPSFPYAGTSQTFESDDTGIERKAPELLEAINRNGLVVFLLANMLTGVVNLCMRTMYATDTVALGILAVYSFVICGSAWACRYRRLWRL